MSDIQELGDKIANLTLLQAKELVDYMKDKYGIEPAGGAVMMAAAPADAAAAADEGPTTVDVILTGLADTTKKVSVIKVIRDLMGLGLQESKAAVEGAPTTVKEGLTKEEAEEIKKKLVEAGGTVDIK